MTNTTAGNYMFTGTRCEIFPKLTIKTKNDAIGVVVVSLLLIMNILHTLF